jgi:5-methylcytosine-specific restriction endonuclease McrA
MSPESDMRQMTEIISRTDAAARGLTRYFTGKRCLNEHISERYTTGGCIACSCTPKRKAHVAAYKAKHYRENTESIAAQRAEYYKKNAQQIAQYHKRNILHVVEYRKKNATSITAQRAGYRKKNTVDIAARQADYRKENVEAITEYAIRYNKEHHEIGRAIRHKRRAQKFSAHYIKHNTPMPADGCCPHCRVEMIGRTRKHGKSDPNAPTQDHIIPLDKGGHHVPGNTMMICLECNNGKSNRSLAIFLKCPRLAKRRAKNERVISMEIAA